MLDKKYRWPGLKSVIKVTSQVEDKARIRKANGALTFNVMRTIAFNLFKQDESIKASMTCKKKMAVLDDNYRSVLLESAIKMC